MSMNEAMRGAKTQLQVLALANGAAQYPDYTSIAPLCDFNAPLCYVTGDRGRKYPAPNWMQITVDALEVWRERRGGGRLVPLSGAEIISAVRQPAVAFNEVAGPALALADPRYSSRYSILKVRLTLKDNTGESRIVDADIGGGFRFGFCGVGASVQVLYPQPGVVVEEGVDRESLQELPDGSTVDTIVQASIGVSPCAPAAAPQLTNTFTRRVDSGGAPQDFEIPPGAFAVSLFTDNPDPTTLTADFVANPLGGSVRSIGRLGPGVTLERPGRFAIPGGARWVRVLGAAAAETASLVFEVAP